MCYNKYIMLNKQTIGKTMQTNKYQIDTLLWSTTTAEEGYLGEEQEVEKDEYKQITFEVYAVDDKDAELQGDDYMNTHYNQELHSADTTITKVGA